MSREEMIAAYKDEIESFYAFSNNRFDPKGYLSRDNLNECIADWIADDQLGSEWADAQSDDSELNAIASAIADIWLA